MANNTWTARTAWTRNLDTPLRRFLRTETGGAAFLLGAALLALAWVNIHPGSYNAVWSTELSIHLGGVSLGMDLRGWVNSGLMAFFFFVVGLEARREFDIGELRERRRFALPLAAGLVGMVGAGRDLPAHQRRPAVDARLGRGDVHRHRVRAGHARAGRPALSRPAAGLPADRRRRGRHRRAVSSSPSSTAGTSTSAAARRPGRAAADPARPGRRVRYGLVYLALGVIAWVAVFHSGIDPIVVGLVIGMLTYANPAPRSDLERATDLFRAFREQPTPELARSARFGLRRRSRPTSGCRRCTTRGPAISSCRCSRWPTPVSRSTATFSRARTRRRSRWASSPATCSASRSASSAAPGW